MFNDLAMKIYKLSTQGYCCTQIMLKLALDEENKGNQDLIKSANGFCKGLGGRQGICGVLSGGIMILSLYAGKGSDGEYSHNNYGSMVNEFIDWFEDEFCSLECIDIIGVNSFEENNNSYMLKCGNILVKSYEKVVDILNENDYEFGYRED
ncbi:C_GCAxxG_C_C family protein [Sedimentibacter hydroxybenzoicus DSM 7310]|uniref:C_GCAxxG_C_C family protein n=1 Tax=Sedimentibacter hydroxybenzoicus DSM 7310 TaxID=1123245 RepID=A0A974GUU8_SEDHY|nr:DV_1555 family C-GCAxxG-C-C protein [Sedimentibacter hydroxybenzoicus]NYB72698.1 C_GCAxxG_C_C family protein [Sedimentibacter hydroxybenzoicus DSM 7310]